MSNREEVISFYSSKLNSRVNIPRDKVCGYRITNPIMKKGYSDGVRADRKNGIVDQTLSRYATEEERGSVDPCEGNTNWLNHRKGLFKEGESLDNQFRINRPEKVVNIFSKNRPLPKNRRGGLGNWEIKRNNFMASPIKPRFVSFDIMEVGDSFAVDYHKRVHAAVSYANKTSGKKFTSKRRGDVIRVWRIQ